MRLRKKEKNTAAIKGAVGTNAGRQAAKPHRGFCQKAAKAASGARRGRVRHCVFAEADKEKRTYNGLKDKTSENTKDLYRKIKTV